MSMFYKKNRYFFIFLFWLFLFSPSLFQDLNYKSVVLLICSACLFWPLTLWRPGLFMGFLVLIAIGVGDIIHVGFFGGLLDHLLIATVLRTNWQETQEFLDILPWNWVIFSMVWMSCAIFAARQVWVFVRKPKYEWEGLQYLASIGLLVWMIFLTLAFFKSYSIETVSRKLKTIYPMHIVRAWTAHQQLSAKLFYEPYFPEESVNAPQVDILVAVIGESASAQRWSLLGYEEEDTNGDLARLKGVRVARAMAHGLNTAATLPYLLTGMNAEDSVKKLSPSFIDLAKKTGYKTFVVSNSRYHSGQEDFYGVTFRRSADVFVKAGNGAFDEVLMPYLEEALQDPAPQKLIVLHTYGSHPLVEKRYPEDQRVLKDIYNNSIHYSSDMLVKWIALVNEAAKNDQTAMLLYTSDHGAAMPPCVDEYRTGSGLTSLQVPFLTWGNELLEQKYPMLQPVFAQSERESLQRSNAELADVAVAAVGYPGALTSLLESPKRDLIFRGQEWNVLNKSDACSLN